MTRKRQRERKSNALNEEYKAFLFKSIESSGRPGSPHRFFESSFDCTFTATTHDERQKKTSKDLTASEETQNKEATESLAQEEQLPNIEIPEIKPSTLSKDSTNGSEIDHNDDYDHHQVVHRHANGLCIVTAGTLVEKFSGVDQKDNSIVKVEFRISAPDPTSLGGKRKKKAKIMKNSNNKNEQPGLIKPSDTIATVTFKNGRQLDLKSCVYGTILELNTKLILSFSEDDKNQGENRVDDNTKNKVSPSLLISDPLLDGYLAVILPNGPFPFRKNSCST